ncbi:cupin domain-containing protein [Pseudonocardia sp. CA-142604]|uniref:cupin domain-containing protein n=1 Tax=Pseudonocardia sp. CA-142604 TaxID=3240024 RepID=UPI003D8F0108
MSFAPGMIALKPGEGRRVDAIGNVRINKAVGADTGGAWALVEVQVTGDGPPLHTHDHEDEAFYVLEGRARVWVGDAEFEAEAGSFVLGPRGVPHTFAGQPGGDLKLLVLIAPAGFEQMFDEIAQLPGDEQQDPSVLGRIAARYGVQILGPPRR